MEDRVGANYVRPKVRSARALPASEMMFTRSKPLRIIAGIIFIGLASAAATAQTTVAIWPGIAPGSEGWKQQKKAIDDTPIGRVIFNVVTPTLTAYLPEKSKATGTGVIIALGLFRLTGLDS